MNHREITKRYSDLINRADQANGRKEIVGLLKKAAKLKSKMKQINKTIDSTNKPEKKGLFGRKKETINEDVKPKKKGLFGKKVEPVKVVEESKKKGWFRQKI